jgi:hypothetical protein
MMDVVSLLKKGLLKSLDFDWLFSWVLARSLNPTDEQLYELEMGVFFFCWRQRDLARGLPWESAIAEQTKIEYAHAQMFALTSLPKFEKLLGRELLHSNWNGKQLNLNGSSAIAKLFFKQPPNKYSWENKLAFMWILEKFQVAFYQALVCRRGDLRFAVIAVQEKNHAIGLQPFVDIDYAIAWRLKLLVALCLLVVRPSLASKW